jgi:hypothetical protein
MQLVEHGDQVGRVVLIGSYEDTGDPIIWVANSIGAQVDAEWTVVPVLEQACEKDRPEVAIGIARYDKECYVGWLGFGGHLWKSGNRNWLSLSLGRTAMRHCIRNLGGTSYAARRF